MERESGNSGKKSLTKPAYPLAGVPDGFHNREVLHQIGYGEKELEELEKLGFQINLSVLNSIN